MRGLGKGIKLNVSFEDTLVNPSPEKHEHLEKEAPCSGCWRDLMLQEGLQEKQQEKAFYIRLSHSCLVMDLVMSLGFSFSTCKRKIALFVTHSRI